jgi:hypothetical protein
MKVDSKGVKITAIVGDSSAGKIKGQAHWPLDCILGARGGILAHARYQLCLYYVIELVLQDAFESSPLLRELKNVLRSAPKRVNTEKVFDVTNVQCSVPGWTRSLSRKEVRISSNIRYGTFCGSIHRFIAQAPSGEKTEPDRRRARMDYNGTAPPMPLVNRVSRLKHLGRRIITTRSVLDKRPRGCAMAAQNGSRLERSGHNNMMLRWIAFHLSQTRYDAGSMDDSIINGPVL